MTLIVTTLITKIEFSGIFIVLSINSNNLNARKVYTLKNLQIKEFALKLGEFFYMWEIFSQKIGKLSPKFSNFGVNSSLGWKKFLQKFVNIPKWKVFFPKNKANFPEVVEFSSKMEENFLKYSTRQKDKRINFFPIFFLCCIFPILF
jgi:hypothetical protein